MDPHIFRTFGTGKSAFSRLFKTDTSLFSMEWNLSPLALFMIKGPRTLSTMATSDVWPCRGYRMLRIPSRYSMISSGISSILKGAKASTSGTVFWGKGENTPFLIRKLLFYKSFNVDQDLLQQINRFYRIIFQFQTMVSPIHNLY